MNRLSLVICQLQIDAHEVQSLRFDQNRIQSLFTCFRSESGLERARRAGSDGKRRLFSSLPSRLAGSKPLSLRKQVNSDWVDRAE